MLSKWGILSIDMQRASISDETVVNEVQEDGFIISENDETNQRKERLNQLMTQKLTKTLKVCLIHQIHR